MQELELLIFTVGETTIGVDTGQVEGMITPEQAEAWKIDVIPLHRMIPFGGRPIQYRSPKVLLRKGSPSCAVLIESPDDIVRVESGSLRLLPAALAASTVRAIWGLAVKGDRAVILVDLDRLDDKKMRAATGEAGFESHPMTGGQDKNKNKEFGRGQGIPASDEGAIQ